jgi:hypothetical protein
MGDLNVLAIEAAISRLREIKGSVFGAGSHGFHLNPPISESEAGAFEQEHGVLLPPDYRQFLTRLGNGGAGPFYGIFPLGVMDDNFDFRVWHENDGMVGTLSKPFRFQDEWNDVSAMPHEHLLEQDAEEYDRQIERFERTYWSSDLMNGAIPICHEGCALRIWMVVAGEQAGKLWEDRRSEYEGVMPVCLDDGSPATFSEWYMEWLDTCFATAGQHNWR